METTRPHPQSDYLIPTLVGFVRWAKGHISPRSSTEGCKTVGVNVPQSLRMNLKQIQRTYNLSCYRDAVYLALLCGVEALDTHEAAIKQEVNN